MKSKYNIGEWFSIGVAFFGVSACMGILVLFGLMVLNII